MRITGVVWLQEVVEKIESKHGVTQAEVEQVLALARRVRKMARGRFRGEHVYRALGETGDGRRLTVFFIHKRRGDALVLSAREMDRKERRSYASKQ